VTIALDEEATAPPILATSSTRPDLNLLADLD
jgi:hypothetical protein